MFNFVLAQGYKVYRAVIQLYEDGLICKIGLGSIKEEILKVKAEMTQGKEILNVIENRASPEEVLALQFGGTP